MGKSLKDLVPGTLIGGRFRLSRTLNRGGMGSIWVAFHETLRVEVVLKLLTTPVEDREMALARFAREANIAATIKSPYVVNVIDFGVDGELPYLAMELLHGEDLGQRLTREGPLLPSDAAKIITQTCKGLYRAHQAGVVHRDIKPENIFLCDDDDGGLVKLLDFGVAKNLEPSATQSGFSTGRAIIGTPPYMSPEQAMGHGRVDFRSDLYSIAVVAYRCLTGRLPFMQDAPGELVVAICTHPHPNPSTLRASLSSEIDAFFRTALEKDPSRRFTSARELADAFSVACATCGLDKIASGRRIAMAPSPRRVIPAPGPLGAIPSPRESVLPTLIAGKFAPHRVLARSSNSRTYLVTTADDQTPRVLKLLLSCAGIKAAQIDALRRTLTSANRIESPHILRVFDVGVADEFGHVPYLLAEFADHGDLESLTSNQPQSPHQVVQWLTAVARPLSKAHAIGMGHEGLRPSRLLFATTPQAELLIKVAGFGMAAFAQELSRSTEQISVPVVPQYLAPEQVRATGTTKAQAFDIWAIGMIAYRLLSGRDYWPAESVANVLAKLLYEPIVPPSARGSSFGPSFDRWFLMSCNRDPIHRFATVEAQIAALRSSLGVKAL